MGSDFALAPEVLKRQDLSLSLWDDIKSEILPLELFFAARELIPLLFPFKRLYFYQL